MFARAGIFLTGLILISSCSTMKKSYQAQCENVPWTKRGYETALAGKKPDIAVYVTECRRYGFKVDEASYKQGYIDGMIRFCTRDNGLLLGRAGKTYDVSCPATKANEFLAGYSQGKMEFDHLQLEKEKMEAMKSSAKSEKTDSQP